MVLKGLGEENEWRERPWQCYSGLRCDLEIGLNYIYRQLCHGLHSNQGTSYIAIFLSLISGSKSQSLFIIEY